MLLLVPAARRVWICLDLQGIGVVACVQRLLVKSSNQICWLGQGFKLAHATAAEGCIDVQEGGAPYLVSQASTSSWHQRKERMTAAHASNSL